MKTITPLTILPKLNSFISPPNDDGLDEIALLMLAAKEDETLRKQILFLIQAPATHRRSLVNNALHEMELRGEPESARAAFAILGTDEGAKAALDCLRRK